MDIVYYSNYCKHSQKLLQYLAKNGLTTKVNCINIDKRKRDPQTNQTHIYLDKGTTVLLPPNVHCVPTLLLVNEKYKAVIGEEIYTYFEPKVNVQNAIATNNNGEPESYSLPSTQNGVNIQSEQYTFYNMSPEELSTKGRGGMRQMYSYVSAFHDNMTINTPPENYRPNKVSSESVEALEQMRSMEMNATNNAPSSISPPISNPTFSTKPILENKYVYTQTPNQPSFNYSPSQQYYPQQQTFNTTQHSQPRYNIIQNKPSYSQYNTQNVQHHI